MFSLQLAVALSGYLLGSIPFGYILVRIFRGQDIRQSGSGNIGATNVSRTSRGLGLVTLLLDAGKGFFAVYLAVLLLHGVTGGAALGNPYLAMSLGALFALLGHMFPVWLRFRGGKGVATAVGSFLLIAPYALLAALGVFLALALTLGYVSLSSIAAASAFPLFAWLFYRGTFTAPVFLSLCLASALVILRHHRNISRLLAGTEPRFQWRRG